MFLSIYYKPSLFNAHTMILTVHIFMNVNKLCLNQDSTSPLSSGTKQKIKGVASRHHQLCSVIAGQGIKEDITSALWSVQSGRHYVGIVECSIRKTLRQHCGVFNQEDITSALWSVQSGRHYVIAVQCGINEDITSPQWSVYVPPSPAWSETSIRAFSRETPFNRFLL